MWEIYDVSKLQNFVSDLNMSSFDQLKTITNLMLYIIPL